nr:unnamed protein product [Spirometra erinaceieuropaei]
MKCFYPGIRIIQATILASCFGVVVSFFSEKDQDWTTCKRGKRQSPIDIHTDQLVYDPTLGAIKFHGADRQLKTLRQLRVEKTLWSASMADNFRPVNALNNRSVRTNINFFPKDDVCAIKPTVTYCGRVNIRLLGADINVQKRTD